jgi:hypothetical protein
LTGEIEWAYVAKMNPAYVTRKDSPACEAPPSVGQLGVLPDHGPSERESEIGRELNKLRDAVSQLESAVEHLEGRVDPVCAPDCPAPARGEATKGPQSAIGRVLSENVERVNAATNRIARILSRIQL